MNNKVKRAKMKNKKIIISIFFFAFLISFTSCKEDNNEMTGIGLDKETVTINAGISTTVIPYPIPWDATVDDEFTWVSKNTDVATVNDSGVVCGIAAGETDVICSYDDYSAIVHVIVTASK
jgi:uncharacterized protein YjdB